MSTAYGTRSIATIWVALVRQLRLQKTLSGVVRRVLSEERGLRRRVWFTSLIGSVKETGLEAADGAG